MPPEKSVGCLVFCVREPGDHSQISEDKEELLLHENGIMLHAFVPFLAL